MLFTIVSGDEHNARVRRHGDRHGAGAAGGRRARRGRQLRLRRRLHSPDAFAAQEEGTPPSSSTRNSLLLLQHPLLTAHRRPFPRCIRRPDLT